MKMNKIKTSKLLTYLKKNINNYKLNYKQQYYLIVNKTKIIQVRFTKNILFWPF